MKLLPTHSIAATLQLIAAPPTPFREDGSVDIDAVAPLAQFLHERNVTGVFINGTTGEWASLDSGERELLAEAWRKALPEDMKLFVHTGHNALVETCRLARHAKTIGADATAALAPSFYKPEGLTGLFDWCHQAAGTAPELPFYFYHLPSMTSVHLRVSHFLEFVDGRIPNLAGVKFTHETMDDFLAASHVADGRYQMLWGRDEVLLGALAVGALGCVGSTYNFASPLYLNLFQAFQRGDLKQARELQLRSIAMIGLLLESGNFLAAMKTVLRLQGVPIQSITRSPLPRVNPEKLATAAEQCLKLLSQPL